jgi:Ca-activated chloride channel family protein
MEAAANISGCHACARTLMLYRMQERAQAEAQAGRFDNAARQLQNMATHLLAQGEYQLAKTALMEAEHLEQSHDFTKSGRKTLKYTTRALMMPEIQEKIE